MFVQIIEGKAKDANGLKRQGERWAARRCPTGSKASWPSSVP